MKSGLLLITLSLLILGCGKKQQTDQQAGTAIKSAYMDVIDSNSGYIVENAQLSDGSDPEAFALSDAVRLVEGTSSVLIIRSDGQATQDETILALQFPAFATGSMVEYSGKPDQAQYWVIGTDKGQRMTINTGLVSGSIRFMTMQASSMNLGLNRDIMDGHGEMEVVVSAIDAGPLKSRTEKKYAAQFRLPLIQLKELVRIHQPA